MKIKENALRRIIKEEFKKVLKESMDLNSDDWTEAIDYGKFADILEDNGWSYFDLKTVSNSHGDRATRYTLSQDRDDATPIEDVVKELKRNANFPDGIIQSSCTHKYAPEIKHPCIIILEKY